jgi:hypothetical protein
MLSPFGFLFGTAFTGLVGDGCEDASEGTGEVGAGSGFSSRGLMQDRNAFVCVTAAGHFDGPTRLVAVRKGEWSSFQRQRNRPAKRWRQQRCYFALRRRLISQ